MVKRGTRAKKYFRETDYPNYWTKKIRQEHYEEGLSNYFVELMKIKKRDKVLEIGAGEGRFIVKIIKKGATYVGVDISDQIIKEARVCISRSTKPNVDLIVGDAENLPLREKYFDKTFCFATIFLIPDRDKVLKEIGRVTKGAVLIDFRNAFNRHAISTYILHIIFANSQSVLRFILSKVIVRGIVSKLFGPHKIDRLEKMLSYRLMQPYYFVTPLGLERIFQRAGMEISYIKGVSPPKLRYHKGRYQSAASEIKIGAKWIKPVLIVKARS